MVGVLEFEWIRDYAILLDMDSYSAMRKIEEMLRNLIRNERKFHEDLRHERLIRKEERELLRNVDYTYLVSRRAKNEFVIRMKEGKNENVILLRIHDEVEEDLHPADKILQNIDNPEFIAQYASKEDDEMEM